jgi:hypothetical protein
MASLLYKNRLIVALADLDPVTKLWTPAVTISWRTDAHEKLHTLDSLSDSFDNRWDAEAFGLERGKLWVNDQF